MSELFLSFIILLLGKRDKKSLLRHGELGRRVLVIVIEQWNFVPLKALVKYDVDSTGHPSSRCDHWLA